GEPLRTYAALRNRRDAAVEGKVDDAVRCEAAMDPGNRLRIDGGGAAGSGRRQDAGIIKWRLVGDRQCREIAPLGLGQPLQGVEMRAHLLRRQRRGGDGAYRVPAVAMPRCAPQRGPGMPADPDWRVRLLQREGVAAG